MSTHAGRARSGSKQRICDAMPLTRSFKDDLVQQQVAAASENLGLPGYSIVPACCRNSWRPGVGKHKSDWLVGQRRIRNRPSHGGPVAVLLGPDPTFVSPGAK